MDVIDRTLERLRAHLELDIAYIAELDGDDMIIRAHCAPDLPIDLPDQFTLPRKDGFCHHMAAGSIPNIVHDTSRNDITANLPTRHDFNIQSYIGIPLHREDGTIYGSVCGIGHQPNHTLNERDLRSVKLFAELVAEQIDKELEDRKLTGDRIERIQSVISGDTFEMWFQPIVALDGGALKEFEALCRFDTVPYRSPDTWFNEAALANMGVELELAAVEKALAALSVLPPDLSLTLNVSPACLISEGLSDLLFDVPRDRLLLEVTEHSIVENYEELVRHVDRYRAQGLRLAVDDAGAGYSSLSHIIQLAPDVIKLDMSLTRDIHTDPIRRSLAHALVHFAGETGAVIVAEGIEVDQERACLASLGVHFGQGYLISKPLPLDQARGFAECETRAAALAG